MKDTGLREERDRELYATYRRGLREQNFANRHEAADWARMQPAPSFFISSKALVNYIGAMEHGSPSPKMRSTTRQKIKLLYQHYLDFLQSHPGCQMSREKICELLVEEPAPHYFIGHETAIKVLKKERLFNMEYLVERWK